MGEKAQRFAEIENYPVCSTSSGETMLTAPSACSVKLSPIASKEGGAAIVTETGTAARRKANMVAQVHAKKNIVVVVLQIGSH